MTGPAAALLVVLSAAATGLIAYLVRRCVTLDLRRRHHEVGAAVFLQLGVVFAVLLAFAFNEAWGGYNEAASAINGECGNLHGAAILADTLPDGARQAVLGAMTDYLHTVIAAEWPAMAEQHSSPQSQATLARLWQAAARAELTTAPAIAARTQILSLLAGAHQERETRLFQMQLQMPPLLWFVLILLSAILVSFVLFSGIEYLVTHVVIAALFAGSVVLILVVMRMLDLPFAGVLALPPTDFQQTLAKVVALTAGG